MEMADSRQKPTIVEMKEGGLFDLVETFQQSRPSEFLSREFRRGGLVVVGFLILWIALFLALIYQTGILGLPLWIAALQIVGGMLVGSVVCALLAMQVQKAVLKRYGVQGGRIELELGSDEDPSVMLIARDHVLSRNEARNLSLSGLVSLPILWVVLAIAFPTARPFFLTILLVQLVTDVGSVAYLSLISRHRGRELFVFDDSTDGLTRFYVRK